MDSYTQTNWPPSPPSYSEQVEPNLSLHYHYGNGPLLDIPIYMFRANTHQKVQPQETSKKNSFCLMGIAAHAGSTWPIASAFWMENLSLVIFWRFIVSKSSPNKAVMQQSSSVLVEHVADQHNKSSFVHYQPIKIQDFFSIL